ncbi:MAG: hypothetical protein HFE90_09250 [Firmicutes bacterium]|nr:hypothetical protein [Bacillota bacterium]
MAQKLKNLNVRKVDFVDEGANQEAHIKLFKRKDDEADGKESESDNVEKSIWKKLLGYISKAADIEPEESDSAEDESQEFDMAIAKAVRDGFTEAVGKLTKNLGEQEGVCEVKIDKSKLTPAEKAFLEDIEKRYGAGDEGQEEGINKNKEDDPADSGAGETGGEAAGNQQDSVNKSNTEADSEDIYKGMHPEVRKELENLKKFREAAEDRELREIAKKYAIIGKKEDELFPMLKNLKAEGGSAYNDMIAILDSNVAALEKAGVFSEIGKAGHGGITGGAWTEAETKAAEIMKSKPGLTMAQAIDQVLMADNELAKRCEEEE